MLETILAAALSLPAYKEDSESLEERTARLTVVATAIDGASARAVCADEPEGCRRIWPGTRKELSMLLLTQAWHETRLAKRIHEDRCRPKECDGGRAKSLWQMHASHVLPRNVWATIGGTDQASTSRAAWYAARYLAGSRHRCAKGGDWVAPTISAYATGNVCEWRGARKRERLFWRLMGR